MPFANANGIEICYESFGPEDSPAVLLIMGLGAQLISWPEAFVEMLVKGGYRVIRFDNRDSGLSTKFEDGQNWAVSKRTFISSFLGRVVPSPYTLQDMADDAVGLLDALKIEKAHIVGASMGGMIAQLIAASYPQRTLSLISFMSSSGSRRVPLGKMKCILRLGRSAKSDLKTDVLQHMADGWKLYASPSFPRLKGELLEWAQRIYDRGYYPQGSTRQFRALLNDGSRVLRLRKITAPTLAMHGSADPLVHPAGSKDVARQVDGAKLVLIDGLGHELPPKALPLLADHMLEHMQAADGEETPTK